MYRETSVIASKHAPDLDKTKVVWSGNPPEFPALLLLGQFRSPSTCTPKFCFQILRYCFESMSRTSTSPFLSLGSVQLNTALLPSGDFLRSLDISSSVVENVSNLCLRSAIYLLRHDYSGDRQFASRQTILFRLPRDLIFLYCQERI